jgi:hypothetical protein
MNRYIVLMASAALACSLQAQPKGGGAPVDLVGDLNQFYNDIKSNLTRAAENMPEVGYSFQPTKEEMTFGQWVAHVADTQATVCGIVIGNTKPLGARSKTTKAELQAALKESFDMCDAAYAGTTMANHLDTLNTFIGMRPRASWLYFNITHDNECYGNMAVYLRLQSLVPPSSQGRGGGGKGKGKQ